MKATESYLSTQSAASFDEVTGLLSVRARRALHMLGVGSIEAFLKLAPMDLLLLRGIGVTTWREIAWLQKRLQSGTVGQTSGAGPLARSGQRNLRTIIAQADLPFFSGIPFEGASIGDLHPSHLPDRTLDEMPVPREITERLHGIGIAKLGELLLVPADELASKCGLEADALERLRAATRASLLNLSPDAYRLLPVESCRLERLPLFSNADLEGVGPDDLHQSYLASMAYMETQFSVRASHVLDRAQVTMLGDLLFTPADRFLQIKGCGEATLEEFRSTVRELLIGQGPSVYHVRTDAFELMIRDYVVHVLGDGMKAECLLARMGVSNGAPATLGELASRYGVTKERIRQICLGSSERLLASTKFRALDGFRSAVSQIIQNAGGVIGVDELAQRMAGRLGWVQPPANDVFRAVIEILNLCTLGAGGKTAVTAGLCLRCEKLSLSLEGMLAESDELRMDDVRSILDACCRRLCDNKAANPPSFSAEFLRTSIQSNDRLRKLVKLQGGTLYTISRWRLCYGPLHQAVEALLSASPHPLHYTKIHQQLAQLKTRPDISKKQVYSALSHTDGVLLWSRGTYVHQACVVLPRPLIHKTERWLLRQLEKNVPCVSARGAFEHFKEECIAAGLPSEWALYACLRLSSHAMLRLPRPPYVYRNAGRDQQPMPVSLLLEETIRDAGGPISAREFEEFANKGMFLKPTQVANLLKEVPSVIRMSTGYIHADNLRIDRRKLSTLIDYIRSILSKQQHISIEKIYQDKIVTCRQIGVDGPVSLYSVLQLHCAKHFAFPRYPQISGQGPDAMYLGEQVVSFVRAKQLPCSYAELEEHFVTTLGYNPSSTLNVAYSDDVFRYVHGCVVHRDTIGWTEAKEDRLEEAAGEAFRDALKRGKCFALAESLIEYHGDQLPELEGDCSWTETLAADILGRSSNFRLLGNLRNCFVPVPNEAGIDTLDDLVYEILKRHFGGGANLVSFSEFLKTEGILKTNLTASMLDPSGKLLITEQEISLRELRAHA